MTELFDRKSPRLKGFDYNSKGAYFITICTKNRKCLLSDIVGTGVLDCPQVQLTDYGAAMITRSICGMFTKNR